MKHHLTLFIVCSLGLLGWAHAAAKERETSDFRVIINLDNPTARVDATFLRDAFLKKRRSWPDGTNIRPADLTERSSVRHVFSEKVLGRAVTAVRIYWRQRVFAGRGVPPPEFARESEIVEYVRRHDGAVGYISVTHPVEGVRVLAVND